MSLGEFFPEEYREQSAGRELKVGAVFKCWDDDCNPPKEKRFIVVGITEDRIALGAVYINSDPNYRFHYREVFQKLQIDLVYNEEDYLDWDSIVDCSKIKCMNLNEVKNLVTEDPTVVLGHLTNEHEKLIFSTLSSAATISNKIKMKFGLI